MQSCPTFCDPMGCSLSGSSICRILQVRIPEWVAIPFSRGSSWLRDRTRASCIAGRFFTIWATREALVLTDRRKGRPYAGSWERFTMKTWGSHILMMLEGRALAWVPVGWGWGWDTLGWLHPQGWLFFKELLVRGLLPCCFPGRSNLTYPDSKISVSSNLLPGRVFAKS